MHVNKQADKGEIWVRTLRKLVTKINGLASKCFEGNAVQGNATQLLRRISPGEEENTRFSKVLCNTRENLKSKTR